MYQDNKSAIILEVNGKISAGKISWALNICYLFITDHVEKENVHIKYCPTDKMWGGFMTKTTHEAEFRNIKNCVLSGNE